MIKWLQMQECAAEWNEIINISNLTTNTFVWSQRVGWCVDWNCSHQCVHSCVSAWINLYLHASSRFGRNSWSTYWRFWIWGKVLWRYQGKSPAPHLSTGSLRSWRVPEDLNLQFIQSLTSFSPNQEWDTNYQGSNKMQELDNKSFCAWL